MTDKNSKRNFKAKVIAKLFGEPDEDIYDNDDALSGNSTEEDVTAATSSISVVHSETQARDVPFYGVHYTLTGQKLKCFNSNIVANGASESESSDGESGNDFVSRKRKRRRKGHHNSLKTDQEITSLTSAAPQATQSVCCPNDSLPVTISSLTKNQKRKLKKKRKEKEKRAQSSPSIEFIYDSSAGTACS